MQHNNIKIKQITSLTHAITNPATGDYLFFDIDQTLLLEGLNKYKDDPQLSESGLAAEIMRLRERGIKVIGLTARKDTCKTQTAEQLTALGINLDEILHAASDKSDPETVQLRKGQVLKDYLELLPAPPTRVFVFDDNLAQLQNIQDVCASLNIPIYLKHYRRPHYQPINITAATNILFPDNLDDFVKVAALGGGTGSVFSIRDPASGLQFVLKYGAHEDAAKIEMLCNALYRVLGVNVPASRIYHVLPKKLAEELNLPSRYGMFQVSEWIDHQPDNAAEIIKQTAQQNFAAHVLLGNIDVAKEDNFLVDQNGAAYLIDAGANFIFRAKGAMRKENAMLAGEIDSLRDDAINATGSEWFGSLTTDEISMQVRAILAKTSELEQVVWDASSQLAIPEILRKQFLEYLSDRIDRLATRFVHGRHRYAKVDKKAVAGQTAAGVLTYTMIDNEPHILLAKRARHDWWDNFGGKSDAQDALLLDTARREVAEESSQTLVFTNAELLASAFHDLVTGEGEQQFLYRMYITPHERVDCSQITDKEHDDYFYVPLSAVIAALGDSCVQLEHDDTNFVYVDGEKLPLYPPLHRMLLQPEVRENLQYLQHALRLKRSRTLGYVKEAELSQPVVDYLPLVTPWQKRQEIVATLQKKSSLLRELKKRDREQRDDDDELRDELVDATVSKKNKQTSALTQSEVYLKTVLGSDYQDGNVEANICCFVNRYYQFPELKSDEKREKFIDECIELLAEERRGGDENIYYYHACNNQIAFAYDVYTALYQAMHADDRWAAFRADSEHFQHFTSIEAFIAFYSDNGSKKIDNNDMHYNDCALSANAFLFGNHQAPTSSSVHYLIENGIRREVNLQQLFSNLLLPFNVAPVEIERLLKIFKDHKEVAGGTLYQIAMPVAEARQMSYPAGYVGVLQEWNGSRDLPAILQTLAGSDLQDKKVAAYIQALQARVMVPPHLPLQVKTMQWEPLDEARQAEYQRELHAAVNAIFAVILQHHSHHQQPHGKTAMLRVLPDILAANQLSAAGELSDAMLTRAILASDTALVGQIFTLHPEYKTRKFSLPKQYIGSDAAVEMIDNLCEPLEMLLVHSQIPTEVIREWYGADWPRALSEVRIPGNNEMKALMSKTGSQHRLALAKELIEILPSGLNIYILLKMIADEQRLEFAEAYLDRMVEYDDKTIHFGRASLSKVVKLLPEKNRFDFVMKHFGGQNDLTEVLRLLQLLRPEERLAIVTIAEKLISNGEELQDVLACLPQAERLLVLQRYEHRISDNYTGIIPLLDAGDQLPFVVRNQEKICDSFTLSEVLPLLPAEHRAGLLFSNLKHINATGILKDVICYASPEEVLTLVWSCREDILQWCDLATVLSKVPEAKRFEVLQAFTPVLRGTKGVELVVGVLPADKRLAFAIEYYDDFSYKPQFNGQLKNVAAALSSAERLELLRAILPKIKPEFRLPTVTKFLSDEEAQALVKELVLQPVDCFDVIAILRVLDPEDRFEYFVRYQDLILDYQIFLDVLYTLAPGECLPACELFQAKICNASQLYVLIRALPEESRLAFAVANMDTILGKKDLPGAKIYQNIFNLILILPSSALPEFYQACIKAADQGYICYAVLRSLPADMRLQFAESHHDALVASEGLYSVIEYLDVDDSITYANKYCSRIADIAELEKILKDLPHVARKPLICTYLYLQGVAIDSRIWDVLLQLPAVNIIGITRLHYVPFDKHYPRTFVLQHLPQQYRLEFITNYLDEIESELQLHCFAKLLEPEERAGFMQAWRDKQAAPRVSVGGLFGSVQQSEPAFPHAQKRKRL